MHADSKFSQAWFDHIFQRTFVSDSKQAPEESCICPVGQPLIHPLFNHHAHRRQLVIPERVKTSAVFIFFETAWAFMRLYNKTRKRHHQSAGQVLPKPPRVTKYPTDTLRNS